MTAKELRGKYLKFFEVKGHKVIPSASLVPSEKVELAGTQRVLFTTAGMHPLVPYLLGEPHPHGKRLVNVQKSLRTDDIDDIGDPWHNTFFEMLGNWSLGDYWKKEAIEWSFEFLTKELKLNPDRISVTVFGGDPEIPGVGEDKESVEIWKSLGIPEERIYRFGKADNWWGPVGETGPCGPDTEMFYDTAAPSHGKDCQPGESCGKYAEIWNDVFMEYDRQPDGSYKKLKQKNVDTGMGVERTMAILQGKDNAYDTELFSSVIQKLENMSANWNVKSARIVADHIRAAIFLIADGVSPSNVDRGYVLRRLIRRAIRHGRLLGINEGLTHQVTKEFVPIYEEFYPELRENIRTIYEELSGEEAKFQKVLTAGLKEFEKLGSEITGKDAFFLYESYGFPPELTFELAADKNLTVDRTLFNEEFTRHQEVSRAGSAKKFAGGLADHSEKVVRGHTATHLLHQALRDVLGKQAHQTGSNITAERIRFDFSYDKKMTPEEIKKVEDIVNQKIKEDLVVTKTLMSQEEADKKGAIGLFPEKYDEKVSIYQIDKYSIEFCGGPHVKNTSEVGKFKIVKEESVGANTRRIKAVLE
ncbi:MAG: alanine--tRNA ligase [Candidatus Woykebacteria bacterium]